MFSQHDVILVTLGHPAPTVETIQSATAISTSRSLSEPYAFDLSVLLLRNHGAPSSVDDV